MSQISAGTVQVTNGSAKVIKSAGGPSWVTVKQGCLFAAQTDVVVYPISAFVPATGGVNDSLTLAAPYQGESGTVAYVIVQDLTPALKLPLINTGDLMTSAIYNEAVRILDFAGPNSASSGGTGGVGGGGSVSPTQAGDMLISVYDTNQDNVVDGSDGPLILASPSTNIGLFPGAIAVPPYFDHPDKTWAYGPYDDHFDGAYGSPVNPKWGPYSVTGTSTCTISRSMVHLFAYSSVGTGPYLQSGVPTGNFQMAAKMKIFNSMQPSGGYVGQAWIAIYAYVGNTMVGSLRLRWNYSSYPTLQAPPYNGLALYLDYGPGLANATLFTALSGTIPEYWGIQYVPRSGYAVGVFSYDGVVWGAALTGLTAAQTGFASADPTTCQFVCYPGPGAETLLSIDWIRFTAI
jgi:hypothetical protein